MRTVRIGSRESALAVAQAELVMKAIQAYDASIVLELVTMKTTGDKDLESPLQKIGGKAVFVKELEQALLDGKIDLCVHSLKDMAVDLNPRLPIQAVGSREDARDVLVLPDWRDSLDLSKPIGCSSNRRTLQLQHLIPGSRVEPVRGNVLTRLQKLDEGQYGALVLAAAGLKRLGLESRISRYFSVHQMIPACGQGIIAVQGRAGEPVDYLLKFHDPFSWDAALAERAYIKALSGGCTSPVTAHAQIQGDTITLSGYAVDRHGGIVPGTFRGTRSDAQCLGVQLGVYLKTEAAKR